MASSALRSFAWKPLLRCVAPRPVGLKSCTAASRTQFPAVRAIATSAARFSFEKLSPDDQSAVRERATKIVKEFNRVDPNKVTEDAKFIEDLGLDSLDAVEIVMALEDEFDIEISDEEAEKVGNLKMALDVVALKVAEK